MVKSSDPAVWAALLKVAQKDPLPKARAAAVVALVECGAACSVPADLVCSVSLQPQQQTLVREGFERAGEVVPECVREPSK